MEEESELQRRAPFVILLNFRQKRPDDEVEHDVDSMDENYEYNNDSHSETE
jgi:hypothetical protein